VNWEVWAGKLTASYHGGFRDHNCNETEEMDRVVAAGARVDRLYVDEGHLGPYRIFKGSLPYPGWVVRMPERPRNPSLSC